MKLPKSAWLFILLLGLLTGTTARTWSAPTEGGAKSPYGPTASARGEPHPVVIPPYRAKIRAAHRVHAEQAKLSCSDCHTAARSSRLAADWLGPKAEGCERCHGPKHSEIATGTALEGDCLRCHLTPPGPRPTAHLAFSHEKHDKRRIACGQCHPSVARSADAAGSERMPRKSACLRCHRGQGRSDGEARATCTTCHESQGGRLRTRFGTQRLQPTTLGLEHGPDFRRTHGAVASNQSRQCRSCHEERECQACHDGRLRPRNIHPGDWLNSHGVASKQGNDCGSCHRAQSFCLSCHQRSGVTAAGPPRALAKRGSMHPSASIWTNGPKGSRHHGVAARRNLTECVSCHQERDCVRCHAAGGLGRTGQSQPFGNGLKMHPAGFATRCASYFARNPRPCLTCHRPDGSEIQRCR